MKGGHREQAHDGLGGQTFAAPGFAHKAYTFPVCDLQGYGIEKGMAPATLFKTDTETSDIENRFFTLH